MNDGSERQASAESAARGFFATLMNGDFGLARTYWLYGVAVSFAFRVLIFLIPSAAIGMVLTVVWVIYAIPLLIGIWKASGRYTGSRVWAILARLVVILGGLSLIFSILAIFSGEY